MEKKDWKKPVKKKSQKHICICQSCLKTSIEKDMKEEMFYWVDRENHYSLHCVDCIDEQKLKIHKPYKKPRKKREKKNKTTD